MSQGLLIILLKYVGDCPSGPRLRRPCLKVSSSSRVLPTIDNHTTVTRCQKGRKIYIDFFSHSNFAIVCDFVIDTEDFRNSAHVFLPTSYDRNKMSERSRELCTVILFAVRFCHNFAILILML